LIFNPFTHQKGLAEPPSHPYYSCTYKATTPPRRALIHHQSVQASAATQKSQKRRAQCHQMRCLSESKLLTFSGERVSTKGYIDLVTTFRRRNATRKIKIRYLVVDGCTPYNALLGKSSLNKLGAIVSTPHLAMKFPTEKGEIATIYVNQRDA